MRLPSSNVFPLRDGLQMIWIHAFRTDATARFDMIQNEVRGDRADMTLIGIAMSHNLFASGIHEMAITILRAATSNPEPAASIGLRNVFGIEAHVASGTCHTFIVPRICTVCTAFCAYATNCMFFR